MWSLGTGQPEACSVELGGGIWTTTKTTTNTALSTKYYEQKSWNFVRTVNQNCEKLTVFLEKTVKTNAILSEKLSK